jgi:magnesium chelatase family protein
MVPAIFRQSNTGSSRGGPARFHHLRLCPSGQLGGPDRPCECTPAVVANYRARLSGPLLDRFEIQVEVPTLPLRDLAEREPGEASTDVAARIAAARRQAAERPATPPTDEARRVLHHAIQRLGLSARAHDAILRVARTIAHLGSAEAVEKPSRCRGDPVPLSRQAARVGVRRTAGDALWGGTHEKDQRRSRALTLGRR